jgi:UDP-N-acetyl-D-mannosaminuronic acid dehydrogenase
LGLTFKANVDDIRESPALHIAEALARSADIRLTACDPMLKALPEPLRKAGVEWNSDPDAAVAAADVVVLLVDHDSFRNIPPDFLSGKPLVDTRGMWAKTIG